MDTESNIQGGDIHAEPFSEDWDFTGYSLYYPSSPEEPVRVTLAEAERVNAELSATAVPGTVAGFAWASDSDWTPCPTACGLPESQQTRPVMCVVLTTIHPLWGETVARPLRADPKFCDPSATFEAGKDMPPILAAARVPSTTVPRTFSLPLG